MIILWLLLTPLFFAFGWFAGRIDMKTVIKHAKTLPESIYDAIDALIDNKTGIASSNMRDIIEQEPQLTELQISLGKLYRNRGENDLAIKLHSKLLNSQYIFSSDDKDKVRLELAKDFGKAGLVDRAESLLLKLKTSKLYANSAQDMLLNIYQQDKNWTDAIETAKNLTRSDYSYHTEVAQFNCELASESLIKSNYNLAHQYINTALETNIKCVRANIILGDLLFSQEKYNDAIDVWQKIEKQNYLYLPMVIDKIFDAYLQLNKVKEGLTLIKGYTTLYPQLNICDFLYKTLLNYETPEATLEYFRASIQKNPSSLIAAKLIELHVSTLSYDAKQDAEAVRTILVKYHEKYSGYRCGCCNFKSKTFFWQCPACYEWESINPNNVEN